MSVSQLLNALADLAPVPAAKPATLDHLGSRRAWGKTFGAVSNARHLEVYDELHRDERLLRQGWGVVRGRMEVEGKLRNVAMPLVSRPVRLNTAATKPHDQIVTGAGDVTVIPALVDTEFAVRLESVFDPELRGDSVEDDAWLADAARAAGFDVVSVHQSLMQPNYTALDVLSRPVVYINKDLALTPIAQGLREWAQRGLEGTALAAVYSDQGSSVPPLEAPQRPRCALPLSGEQADAVTQARHAPVTVVTGAPGCGKSHTLAAIALDTVAAGQSVLIATQSVHAADVLAAMLERHPGPLPVRFGDSEHREEFATQLGSGVTKGHPKREVEERLRTAADALDFVDRIETEIETWLGLEETRRRAQDAPVFLLNDFPQLHGADLDKVERLLTVTQSRHGGFWARLKLARAKRRLRSLTGAEGTADALRRAITVARDQQGMTKLASAGGLHLEPLWQHLDAADREASEAVGKALETETGSAERRSGPASRALASLAAALRVGKRSSRRHILGRVSTEALLGAMPLWIGTVSDVEDVLPTGPGMFDLVILDEASHINQLRAAPVLARARRAVVAGDPRQLRFVSFSSEDKLRDVLERHELQDWSDRLDTGRVSAYDLATGAGPVVELTEHHRSVPHLIGFSAAKFYHGRVKPITTHPRNHAADAITVHRVSAHKSAKGLVKAEVERSMDLLAELVEHGDSSLAVLTPFRAQAEAIEAAIVERFDLETIRRRRIRTGTVHAFQGSEADTVIAALGVADGDPAGRKRFMAGANLFNVMMTRAREHLHVVTALDDADGLVGEFLKYADSPPTSPQDGDARPDDWTVKLSENLSHSDIRVRRSYPVGNWSIDLVVGDGDGAVGVISAVHPEGAAAHLARYRALRRTGWKLVDAFPSTYDDDPARAAVEILSGVKN